MLPWSDDRFDATDRAAVEPVAALVAVLAVGAGLGLYAVALDGATPTPEPDARAADATLERVERDVSVGGIVRPDRLYHLEGTPQATVEVATERRTWRVDLGDGSPTAGRTDPRSDRVAERPVTVAVGPGEAVRGVLRVVIDR